MKKSFAKFLMYLTGLYALLGYAMLLIWFIGVMLNLLFGEVSFLPSFLFNMISIIESLIASGMVGFITSLVSWAFYGISFLIIAVSVGYSVEIFESIMAVMGANAIANLPITVGGAGLAEFGIVAYLNNLDPFNFVMPDTGLEWNAVIGWRIATYYIPIAVTWVLLVKLALSKYTKPTTT